MDVSIRVSQSTLSKKGESSGEKYGKDAVAPVKSLGRVQLLRPHGL